MRRIEKRGVVNVLCDDDGNGCMPATRAEVEFFDELTRLRADVEALKAKLAEYSRANDRIVAELRECDREVEALRADAERYRWIDEHCLIVDCVADPDNFVQVWAGDRRFYGRTLEAVIDAARAAQGERG